MIIPLRCFSCGKPIGHLWEKYQEMLEKGEKSGKILDSLGVERYCCRSLFLGQTDLIKLIGRYKKV